MKMVYGWALLNIEFQGNEKWKNESDEDYITSSINAFKDSTIYVGKGWEYMGHKGRFYVVKELVIY